jgi:hypothetical protein
VDDVENARSRLELLREIDPGSPETLDAEADMARYNMEKSTSTWGQYFTSARTVNSRGYDKSVQTDQKPVFNHPEIESLYEHGLEIGHHLLEEILALPQKTLIQDLEAVLHDTICRYEFFRNEVTTKGWNDQSHNFSVHAIFLLTELKVVTHCRSSWTFCVREKSFWTFGMLTLSKIFLRNLWHSSQKTS